MEIYVFRVFKLSFKTLICFFTTSARVGGRLHRVGGGRECNQNVAARSVGLLGRPVARFSVVHRRYS